MLFPGIGSIPIIIQTKRGIPKQPAMDQMESETNEWFYWNGVWLLEVALSEWLMREFYTEKLIGKTILELGCGTGLPGFICAHLFRQTTDDSGFCKRSVRIKQNSGLWHCNPGLVEFIPYC